MFFETCMTFQIKVLFGILPFSIFTSFSFLLKHVKQMFHTCIDFSKQNQNLKTMPKSRGKNLQFLLCFLQHMGSSLSVSTFLLYFLSTFPLLSPFPFSLHFLATSLYAFSLTPQFLPLLTCLFSSHSLLLSLSTFF